jgi:DNA mismatch repair protein MutL
VHDLIRRGVNERLRAQAPEIAAAAETTPVNAPASEDGRARGTLRLVPSTAGNADLLVQAAWPARTPARPLVAPEPSEVPPPAAEPTLHQAPEETPQSGFFAALRVIGQAFEGYLVCEGGESLLVIDQHAAHERVMFEGLRRAWSEGKVTRQQLLLPTVVDVDAQAAPLVAEHLAELEKIGFELEPYGGNSFAVRAVPAVLGDADPEGLVRDLAEELAEVGRSSRMTQAIEAVLARLACHSAVRVGQVLNGEQIRALLSSMDGIDFAGNCPHGRPAFITLPRSDLERLFKRT